MKRWLEFLKERLPLHVLLISSVGMSGSSQALSPYPYSWTSIAIGTVLAFIFFLTMRVMDEVKDFKKDQIAHPTRPLPRGLISLKEMKSAVIVGITLSFLATLGLCFSPYCRTGMIFGFSTVYLCLMYKEFFVSDWLEERILLYTISHQLVLVFLTASLAALVYPSFDQWLDLLKPGLLFLGIFFTFEIARKLDPSSHPILQTYRVRFGVKKSGLLLTLGCFLTLLGVAVNQGYLGKAAYLLGFGPVLLVLLYARLVEKNFKTIEGLAGLWVLFIVWTPFILRAFGL